MRERDQPLSKRDRVQRALAGAPLDRPPYSFWTHLPGIDLDPEALVAETLRFVAALDLDFVKAMSNGLFCVEDWGVAADYSAIAEGGVARVVATPVAAPGDWRRIGVLPADASALARELRHLAGLTAALGAATPVLATVFSPLTIAHKLAGEALARHFREAPGLVLAALGNIAATTAGFARAALQAGCAGVFFAVQDADPSHITEAEYVAFGERFDRMVLEAASGGWFNVVHMHGRQVMFDRLRDYPVAALNWHIGEAEPTVAAYRASGGTRPIVGGLRRDCLTRGDLAGVQADLKTITAATGGRGVLLAPGCVIRHPVDLDFLGNVVRLISQIPFLENSGA